MRSQMIMSIHSHNISNYLHCEVNIYSSNKGRTHNSHHHNCEIPNLVRPRSIPNSHENNKPKHQRNNRCRETGNVDIIVLIKVGGFSRLASNEMRRRRKHRTQHLVVERPIWGSLHFLYGLRLNFGRVDVPIRGCVTFRHGQLVAPIGQNPPDCVLVKLAQSRAWFSTLHILQAEIPSVGGAVKPGFSPGNPPKTRLAPTANLGRRRQIPSAII